MSVGILGNMVARIWANDPKLKFADVISALEGQIKSGIAMVMSSTNPRNWRRSVLSKHNIPLLREPDPKHKSTKLTSHPD